MSVKGHILPFSFVVRMTLAIFEEGTFTKGWGFSYPSPTSIDGTEAGQGVGAEVAGYKGKEVEGEPQSKTRPTDLSKKGKGGSRSTAGLPLRCSGNCAGATERGSGTSMRKDDAAKLRVPGRYRFARL